MAEFLYQVEQEEKVLMSRDAHGRFMERYEAFLLPYRQLLIDLDADFSLPYEIANAANIGVRFDRFIGDEFYLRDVVTKSGQVYAVEKKVVSRIDRSFNGQKFVDIPTYSTERSVSLLDTREKPVGDLTGIRLFSINDRKWLYQEQFMRNGRKGIDRVWNRKTVEATPEQFDLFARYLEAERGYDGFSDNSDPSTPKPSPSPLVLV